MAMSAMNNTPEVVCRVGAVLGEGPCWHAPTQTLWFVDIKAPEVLRFDPATGALKRWPMPAQVGWVLPIADGQWLVGLQTGIHRFDPATGAVRLCLQPEAARPGNRLNDACTDPQGRLWFGSMDDGETQTSGRFYRAQQGRCEDTGLAPVCITNGPAVSGDGRLLAHTDTLGRVISMADIASDGSVGAAREFARIGDADGYPDGPVFDSEGALWTGLFFGGAVRCYSAQGQVLHHLPFPVSSITKLAFGGPDLRTVYATTARKGMSAEMLAQQPHAGDLFAFRVEVPGLPVTPLRASDW
jgi:xylono-1,5-lactonase